MKMQRLYGLITPCVMFITLIFSGQQGYVVFKEYKKVSEKVSDPDKAISEPVKAQDFALFQPAVYQDVPQRAVKAPISAEVEGIINSDEAWMSFAVIKTPSGQQSYREGEPDGLQRCLDRGDQPRQRGDQLPGHSPDAGHKTPRLL